MKKFRYLLIVIFGIMACSISSAQTDPQQSFTIKGEKTNSIPNGSIDSLNNDTQEEFNELKKQTEGKLDAWLFYAALVFIALLFVVSIMICKKCVCKSKKNNEMSDRTKSSNAYVTHTAYNKDQENIGKKLKKLEEQISKLSKKIEEIQPKLAAEEKPEQKLTTNKKEETFYLGVYNEEIFSKKISSDNEEALFKASKIEDGVYSITPLNLERIKSHPSRDTVLEKTGCLWDDAKKMECIEPGKVREEDNYWKVVKKVEVKLK